MASIQIGVPGQDIGDKLFKGVKEIDCTDKVPPVRWDDPDDQIVVNCAGCGVPVLTFWKPGGGGLLRGEYVIVADWIYHPRCFDRAFRFYGGVLGDNALVRRQELFHEDSAFDEEMEIEFKTKDIR